MSGYPDYIADPLNEAERYRDRGGGGSSGGGSSGGPSGGMSMEDAESAFGPSGGSSIDYSDPMQNYGIAEAQRDSWDFGVYVDFVQDYRDDVHGADVHLLNKAPGGGQGLLWDEVPSGFNDPNSLSGFNQLGPATENTGRDAYFFYQRAPEARRAYLQDLMYRAGLVDEQPRGGWGSILDQDYLDSWKLVVETSQRSGIPIYVLLEQEAEALAARGGPGGGRGGGGGGPRRPTAQIISEDDARSIVDEVAKEELGRKLSDEEESLANGIVQAIRSKMSAEANAVIDQQMAGGGTVSQPTNPRVTAQNEIESRREDESTAYDLAQAFANLVGLAGGGRA